MQIVEAKHHVNDSAVRELRALLLDCPLQFRQDRLTFAHKSLRDFFCSSYRRRRPELARELVTTVDVLFVLDVTGSMRRFWHTENGVVVSALPSLMQLSRAVLRPRQASVCGR